MGGGRQRSHWGKSPKCPIVFSQNYKHEKCQNIATTFFFSSSSSFVTFSSHSGSRSERRGEDEHQGFPVLRPRLPAAHRPDEVPPPGAASVHPGPLHGTAPPQFPSFSALQDAEPLFLLSCLLKSSLKICIA